MARLRIVDGSSFITTGVLKRVKSGRDPQKKSRITVWFSNSTSGYISKEVKAGS